MRETILLLKTLLEAERFIVTGSYILSLFGLVKKDKVNDLDIILINPTEETENILKRFMREHPAKTKPYPGSQLQYIFMFQEIKIDIFIQSSFKECIIELSDFEGTTIPWIMKAKKSYGRMKDWISMRDMSRIIFKPDEFDTFLNNYSSQVRRKVEEVEEGELKKKAPKRNIKEKED